MRVTKHFELHEFIGPDLYNKRGRHSITLMDDRMLMLPEVEKEYFSNLYETEVFIVINDYHWGGQRDESGYRDPNTKTGAKWSQHKEGRALDSKYYYREKNGSKIWIPANEIRLLMLQDQEFFMKHGITRLESDQYAPTWVHRDCAYTGMNHIKMIAPAN